MTKQSDYNDIIKFAIGNEQDAIDLYTDLAAKTDSPSGKVLLKELADMERGHKAKLEKLDMSYFTTQEIKPPQDLKISDYLVDVKLEPNASYQDILLFSAKQEKAAFDLYTDLAQLYASEPDMQKMFQVLAQEEAYHKLMLEREYDENVLSEN